MRAIPNLDNKFTGSQIRTEGPANATQVMSDLNQTLLSTITLHDNGTKTRPDFAEANMVWAATTGGGPTNDKTTEVFLFDGTKDQPLLKVNSTQGKTDLVIEGDVKIGGKIWIDGNTDPIQPDVGGGTASDSSVVGEMRFFADGVELPPNYEWAAGGTVNKTEYPELWTAIGNSYGPGDGTEGSFNLPNITRLLENSPQKAVKGEQKISYSSQDIPWITTLYSHFFGKRIALVVINDMSNQKALHIHDMDSPHAPRLCGTSSAQFGYQLVREAIDVSTDTTTLKLIAVSEEFMLYYIIWDGAGANSVRTVDIKRLHKYSEPRLTNRDLDNNVYFVGSTDYSATYPNTVNLWKLASGANSPQNLGSLSAPLAPTWTFYDKIKNNLFIFTGNNFYRASITTGFLTGYPKKLTSMGTSSFQNDTYFDENRRNVWYISNNSSGTKSYLYSWDIDAEIETQYELPSRCYARYEPMMGPYFGDDSLFFVTQSNTDVGNIYIFDINTKRWLEYGPSGIGNKVFNPVTTIKRWITYGEETKELKLFNPVSAKNIAGQITSPYIEDIRIPFKQLIPAIKMK